MGIKIHPDFETFSDDYLLSDENQKPKNPFEGINPLNKPNKPAILINELSVKAKKSGTRILNNISMEAEFGELTAIMGPSGSGKTTLLSFLADIRASNLKYLGRKFIAGDYKYVPQEDFLHGFMSVEKYINSYFGLNYGFMNHSQSEEKNRIKNLIISEMHLTKTEKTKVGDIFQHGLSGGEKRRLSIALELVSRPRLIILDEPTSGLDSYAAEKVIFALKGLAIQEKIAVITTIHQPSSRIFQIIDKVLFLKEGQIMYQGPTKLVRSFFQAQGETEWESYNPADQALELLDRKTVNPVPNQLKFSSEQVVVDKKLETEGRIFNNKKARNIEKFIF